MCFINVLRNTVVSFLGLCSNISTVVVIQGSPITPA